MNITCKICSGPLGWRGGEFSTLVGYRSPPGHNHDDNCLKRIYECPNGHITSLSKRRRCHACDWVGKLTCFCHAGDKLDEWPDIPQMEMPKVSEVG